MNPDFALESGQAWAARLDDFARTDYTAALRVQRAAIHIEHQLNQLIADNGFSVLGDFQVAAMLARSEPLRPTQIAKELLVTKAALTGRVGRLERLGFVEREPDPADARVSQLNLTPLGHRCTTSAVAKVAAFYAELFSGLDRASVETVESVLGTIIARLRSDEDGPG